MTGVGFEVLPSTSPSAQPFHGDLLTIDSVTGIVQRVKLVIGAPGLGADVSSSNPIPVVPSAAGDGASSLTDGRKTATTAGTRVSLATTQACKWVAITALLTNTQPVFVGGSQVTAASGSEKGTPLNPGDSTTLPVTDASLVFLDSRVNGEGVSFTVGA